MSVLYQIGQSDIFDIDFAGGHGFTGLHYVNHGKTSLQFSCQARLR